MPSRIFLETAAVINTGQMRSFLKHAVPSKYGYWLVLDMIRKQLDDIAIRKVRPTHLSLMLL